MYQGKIWRASALVALALVMPALAGVTASTAFAADKLRVVGNVSEEIENKVYDDIMPTFSTDGKFNPKALDTLAQSFVELGTWPEKPDMTKVITEKYLPGAPQ